MELIGSRRGCKDGDMSTVGKRRSEHDRSELRLVRPSGCRRLGVLVAVWLLVRRGIREVPCPGDERGGHDPRRRANDALALVFSTDRVELGVDVLRDVPDEGENFAYAATRDREGSEEVDDCMRD